MLTTTLSLLALGALLPTATLAQTHTACNPLNTTGCPDMPALGGNATFNFNQTWNTKLFEQRNQGSVEWTPQGTSFTVAHRGDAPYIQSSFYLFFGRLEVIMKAAPGQGIISSAILQSECLDEVDWEFLGGNTSHVLTNYFGKGNTTDYTRGKDFTMSTPPQEGFHNYTLDWTAERTQWWLDGTMLRELKFGDALGGKNYPQTPMNIRMGVWSGGDVENNDPDTVAWAGGATDFDKGPFTMMVASVYAQDYTTAKTYSWADMDASGAWQKVKVLEPNVTSTALKEIQNPHAAVRAWKDLSKPTQIGIISGVIGAIVLSFCVIIFCCIKQRRAGRREHAAHQAALDKEATEMMEAKQAWTISHIRHSRYERI